MRACRRHFGAWAFNALALLRVATACSSSDGAGSAASDASADSSPDDAGGDVVQPPPGCDEKADPKDAPKCVVNDYGVFADATNGADSNPGTKESPVKSITAANRQRFSRKLDAS